MSCDENGGRVVRQRLWCRHWQARILPPQPTTKIHLKLRPFRARRGAVRSDCSNRMEGPVAMGAVTNIFRRGAVYYYRRSIRSPDGQICRICLSLRTRRLEVARRRGAALAVALDELRTRLAMVTMRQGLSAEQRRLIGWRQNAIEHDALHTLHSAICRTPDNEAFPGRLIEFPSQLLAMEIVCSEWAVYGWPRPRDISDLKAYLIDAFDYRLSETVIIDVWGGLKCSTAYVEDKLNCGAESALQAAGADITEQKRFEAILLALREKLRCLCSFRKWIENPTTPFLEQDTPEEVLVSGGSVFPIDVDWPSRLLLNIDHSAWLEPASSSSGQSVSVPRTGKTSEPTSNVRNEHHGYTNSELVDRFCLEVMKCGTKRARWGPKTESQFRSTMMLLDKLVRRRNFADVKAQDFSDLSLMFNRLPVHHHKSAADINRTLEEIAEAAAKELADGKLTEKDIGLSKSTTNRHFTFLRKFYGWVSKPIRDSVEWENFIERDDRDKRKLRPAFEVPQGIVIFSLPIWTGCRSETDFLSPGENTFHGSGYWIPLLLWYSGCRREEVCGLLLDEISSDHGISYLKVQNNTLRSVKNVAAEREVPIHPEILRLGFLEYVKALRVRGGTRLFPDLEAEKTPPGDMWFDRYWSRMAKVLPFVKPGMGAHSMRHTVATELKHAKVPVQLSSDFLGHAVSGEAGRYGKASRVETLFFEVVQKIPSVTAHLEARPLNLATLHVKPRTATRAETNPLATAYRPRRRLVL